jgi:hypothetical protein
MMAEARRLVTSGPHRFVRHPLYLAEELAIIGISMQFFSLATAFVLAVQIAFQLRRMHNEEAVLAERLSGIRRLPAKDRPAAARNLPAAARNLLTRATLTHQALGAWSPLSRTAGEGVESSEADERVP